MRGARYSEDAIRALVESYYETSARRDTTPQGLNALVRIADLDLALKRLSTEYREVVLLHGMLGVPNRETARLLEKSTGWVSKRLNHAISDLAYLMNGGE